MRPFLRDLGGRDPYEILQVPRNATTDEIIAAHRRLVRRLHPDSPTGDADAAALLNVARDILSDPVTRAEYDRFAAERAAGSAKTTTSGTGRAASGAQEAWFTSDAGVPHAAEQPSAWDGEDVVTGAARSPNAYWRAEEPAANSPPTYPHPGYVPPAYPPHYVPVPPPPGVGLGVTALVFSFACTPIGLILGIVGSARYPRDSPGRICSIIAVVISVTLLCLPPLLWLLSTLVLRDLTVPAEPMSTPVPGIT